MPRAALTSFWITVAVLWLAVAVTARYYPFPQGTPASLEAALAAAMGVEIALYAGMGFHSVRRAWAAIGPGAKLAGALAGSGVAPYAIWVLAAGTFEVRWAAVLVALVCVAAFWYVVWPANDVADAGYLVLVAGVLLSGVFRLVYTAPVAKVPAEVLGHLMWIRLCVLAVLVVRRAPERGLGFVPNAREWKTGALCYAGFLPFGLALGWLAGMTKLNPAAFTALGLAKAAATFLAMLWVVALGEEFFFRGMLQPLLGKWLHSSVAGLVAASVLFGLAHLGFRGFPNWTFAALATVAGIFYGTAFLRTGSVRAAMVTHALVNLTWRSFLSG